MVRNALVKVPCKNVKENRGKKCVSGLYFNEMKCVLYAVSAFFIKRNQYFTTLDPSTQLRPINIYLQNFFKQKGKLAIDSEWRNSN